MAVDRGGLQYTIKVRDEFSKVTGRFKSEMRASKAAFAEFQKGVSAQRESAASFKKTSKAIDEQQALLRRLSEESKRQTRVEREAVRIRNTQQRDSTRATRERLAAEKKASQEREKLLKQEQRQLKELIDSKNRAAKQAERLEQARRKDEARNLTDQQRQLKAFADAQAAREREAARIHKSMSLDEQRELKRRVDAQTRAAKEAQKLEAARQKDEGRRQRQDPAFIAQQRLNKGLKEEVIQRNQIGLLRARAQSQFQSGDLFGGSKSLKQAKDLESQLKNVDKAGNSILFTFRRLIGVLAIFTIARNVVQGFQDLVRAGVNFNDTVQSATTSIAGLLVAVTDVRDELGQSVPPAEQLSLAMKAADDQVKKLRQDALRTVATFEQLLNTFQIAVAPGFAAGLNLDEIRKLTVSISQAAAAIGVEQNQLAEEVRSLLSGTIQARTTRIATALGITNADIRRLKETGELFNFLEDRFSAFALSAERQARTTLQGIGTLIEGATTELLGDAAKPLFDELIDLGNQFFDQVLTIVDAEGNLKPNPEVVQGFREIFEALRDGVQEIRAAAERLGFEGLQNTFRAVGTALVTSIRFAIGFAETLLVVLNAVVTTVSSISDFFGLTTRELGRVAGALGVVIASTLIWNNTVGKLGISFGGIFKILRALVPSLGLLQAASLRWIASLKGAAVAIGQVAAVLAVVIVGFDQILGQIFDVNLTLGETIRLLGKGLAAQIKESVKGLKGLAILLDPTISAQEGGEKLRALAAELRADEEQFNKEIAAIVGNAAGREARGPGFDASFDFKKKLDDATKAGSAFKGIISAADAEIAALAGSLLELQNQINRTGEEFRAAFNAKDLQGVGAKIQDLFSDAAVESADKLRKLRTADKSVEESIAALIEDQNISAARRAAIEKAASSDLKDRRKALQSLNLTEAEGQLVSLLRDQKDIRAGIFDFEEKSLQLAFKKAAIEAVNASRQLNREQVLLDQQLVAERAISQVVAARLGQRRAAVVEAENALNISKAEALQAQQALQDQITFLEANKPAQTGPTAASAAELQAFDDLLVSLRARLAVEQDLSAEKLKQLEVIRAEAALVESGTLTQGLSRGFEQLANDLPSAFEAGIEIVRQGTQQLTSFISSSIVSAFDPTDDSSLQEKFARFLQGIANLILQQIIQLAIAAALQKTLGETSAATVEITAATTAAAIKTTAATTAAATEIAAAQAAAAIRSVSSFGFHSGGLVKGYNKGGKVAGRGVASPAHALAKGFAAGGAPRPPRGLHPADTVPAWLQPGEFVVRKNVVDNLGLGFFKAVNSGSFGLTGSAPTGEGAAASAGMAKGGLVSDQVQRAAVSTSSSREGDVQLVPVQVAGERQLDRILAGGKSAARQFLQDNASIIRSISKG